MDQSFNDAALLGELYGEGAFCFNDTKPDPITVSVPSDDSNFDCNICLEAVQEPVVTLCGHLFCWPCIHKWLDVQSFPTSDEYQRYTQCPVCKSKVSHSTLVPLYGRGRCAALEEGKSSVPRRPLGPVQKLEMPSDQQLSERFHFSDQHEGYYPVSGVLSSNSLSYSSVMDPMMVMVGEMVAARLFGTQMMDRFAYPDTYNLGETSGPRMRRRITQADKSLGRIFFFLMCCVALCLLLF